jgi:hypothetical protein
VSKVKCEASVLQEQLKAIHCSGLISSAVIDQGLGCVAYNKALGMLLVQKPILPAQTEDKYGVLDISVLLRSVADEGEVELEFNPHTITLTQNNTEWIFRTGEPNETINTFVAPHQLERIQTFLKENTVIELPITEEMRREILRAVTVMKADQLRITFMPGEVAFVAGKKTGHRANVNFKGLWTDTFSVLLNAKPMSTILQRERDTVIMQMTGKDSMVQIVSETSNYVLNPQTKES